jgi:integrase
MASLYQINKSWILDISYGGKRPRFRLGSIAKRSAESIEAHITALIEAKRAGDAVPARTEAWLQECDTRIRDRLEKLGLVKTIRVSKQVTLGEHVDQYVKCSTSKLSTKISYQQTIAKLLSHFGTAKLLTEIDALGIDQWVAGLWADGNARATVGKHVKNAKAIFNCATRWEYLDESPMKQVPKLSQANPANSHYVEDSVFRQVLNHETNPVVQAVMALARYCGLRIPSEVKELTWGDVDLGRARLRVVASKTANKPKHHVRHVPIPKIVGATLRALPQGGRADLVFPRLVSAQYLGRRLKAICKRLHVPMWPRAAQNLRASCAIDYARLVSPPVAAQFMGHSMLVAETHYVSPQQSDFQRISDDPLFAELDTASFAGAKCDALVTQNATQHVSASVCTDSHDSLQLLNVLGSMHVDAQTCASVQGLLMGDGGLEPLAGNAVKTGQCPNSGAKSDAVGTPVPLPESQSQGRAWDQSISRLSEAHQRLVWELVCGLLAG